MLKKLGSVLYCAVFFAICAFFSLGLLLGEGVAGSVDRDTVPALVNEEGLNQKIGTEYEKWFSENFAFRDSVVDLFSSLKETLLLEGNDQVVVGKENFLFFGDTTADYLGQSVLTAEEIDAIAEGLASLQEKARAQGADFLFVCAPNKNTIYGSMMPDRFLKGEGATNMDLLYAALREKGVAYLDLRPILTKAANEELIYHKRDSHWNGRGAEIAFGAVAEHFGFSMADLTGRGPYVTQDFEGDLDALMFPGETRYDENVTYEFEGLYAYTSAFSTPMDLVITARGGGEGKLLMFRDSFANAWIPYAASSCREIRLERATPYRTQYIDSMKPDYVVVEIAERNLYTLTEALQSHAN